VLRAFARVKAASPAPRDPGAAPAERSAKSNGSRARPGFVTVAESELPIDAEPRADVVVLDTIGELAQLYQLATAVFVGGSLADHGGHNILEPAMFGKPIVFGPHMQNFKEIAEAFVATAPRCRCGREQELDDTMLRARRRSGAARASGRGGAGAGRSQSRSQGQDAHRHRRAASCRLGRRRRRRPAVPASALTVMRPVGGAPV
jgi:3-deoxy-D-manno-octulosonic-acid transferase